MPRYWNESLPLLYYCFVDSLKITVGDVGYKLLFHHNSTI